MTLKELIRELESTGLSNGTEIKMLTTNGIIGLGVIYVEDYSDGKIQIILIPKGN